LKRTPDGWRWLCRHCTNAQYRDALDFVQRRDNVPVAEAARILAGDVPSLAAAEPRQVAAASAPPADFSAVAFQAAERLDGDTPLAHQVREYLTRRGLIEPTWRRAMLGAALAWDGKLRRERPVASMPYFDAALEIRAIKYRFVDDCPDGLRYTQHKGSRCGLYTLPETLGGFDTLLVVEGELNLLSVAQVLPELDLVSPGSQELPATLRAELLHLAKSYRKVLVWLDDEQRANGLAADIPNAAAMKTPVLDNQKWDANRLLQADRLHGFIERMTGARVQRLDARRVETRPHLMCADIHK
jgi:hypothetical protein